MPEDFLAQLNSFSEFWWSKKSLASAYSHLLGRTLNVLIFCLPTIRIFSTVFLQFYMDFLIPKSAHNMQAECLDYIRSFDGNFSGFVEDHFSGLRSEISPSDLAFIGNLEFEKNASLPFVISAFSSFVLMAYLALSTFKFQVHQFKTLLPSQNLYTVRFLTNVMFLLLLSMAEFYNYFLSDNSVKDSFHGFAADMDAVTS